MGEFGVQPPREKRLVAVIGSKSHKCVFSTEAKHTAALLSREVSLWHYLYMCHALQISLCVMGMVDSTLFQCHLINEPLLMC